MTHEPERQRAIAWLTTSPIRVDHPGAPGHGAILHGIDQRRGPMGLYTEITGYAVSLFASLMPGAQGGALQTLERAATDAADYLVGIQDKDGAYPHLPDSGARGGAGAGPWSAYSFDVAACIVGLARLHKAVPDRGYLDSATRAGRWLMGLQRDDGSYVALQRQDGQRPDPGGFYGTGSCIHAKNAIALLELHAATGEPALLRAAEAVCERTLALQAEDGAFWCSPSARYVFSHAHAYACEGLLYAGTVLDAGRLTDSARRGIDWLSRRQGGDGAWLSHHKTKLASRRGLAGALLRPRPTDAAAQAARLFSLAGPEHDASRRAALAFVLSCQVPGGGFHYRRTLFGDSPFLNTWSAQFAAQALTWDAAPARAGDLF